LLTYPTLSPHTDCVYIATPSLRLRLFTVATAEIQFENYVLSRGGNRLIRKILIANNGCTLPLFQT